ncbi:PEP-CTERM sorting domain-containing protein [Microcoleus sp. AR_TQ3_B6]|uniref:PEP-CTERM sorting domain-containing protein n=1 Tax=Microcoleus sp. AR_TQ3_B6 TaxID=3055284 RepID=UPI002FD3C466
MNNLYQKVAFASVCTALSLALVANKEAKAGVITLTPNSSFIVGDRNDRDGVGDYISGDVPLPVGIINGEGYRQEYRAFYEFNMANVSLDPNTVISRVIFRVNSNTISWYERFSRLDLHGYTGDGQADVSDFGAGEFLDGKYLYSVLFNPTPGIKPYFVFDVLPFISQRIQNNDTFAGFSLRTDEAYLTLKEDASLTIITADVAEPVPEPTTIFGSALALSLGGWLKRKKSNQQHKTTSQG